MVARRFPLGAHVDPFAQVFGHAGDHGAGDVVTGRRRQLLDLDLDPLEQDLGIGGRRRVEVTRVLLGFLLLLLEL